jgi:aspartyl-tRNA(Asn)/glutamyl-tRNA(Gln) amidotransferase subunit A
MDASLASLSSAASAIARGDTTSEALVRECLARALRANATLNCFLRIDAEAALDAARAADAATAAGAPRGPLHGVPIALKDMFYDPPRPSTAGAAFFAKHHVPTRAATVVERLRRAGAISIGTLNMTEFAFGPTGHNRSFGACVNPWDTTRIAGGSSSGAGAALAARLVPGALGSDTGGSIRGPASMNGILGLKPTYGLVPRTGAMPMSWSCDHVGPMARTAEDVARLLGVLAGHDPADPTSRRAPVADYAASLGAGLAGLRLGVPRRHYFEEVDAGVGRALEAALATLAREGATLVPVDAPPPGPLSELGRVLVYSEAAAAHAPLLREHADEYSPQVRTRILTGFSIPAPTYLAALQARPRVLREFVAATLQGCDALLLPTLAVAVPTLAATDVGGGDEMWNVIAALVRNVAPFNYLGLPALSVPAGFDGSGLPVGLQVVGRPFAEARLLRIAAGFQRASDWHERVPPGY